MNLALEIDDFLLILCSSDVDGRLVSTLKGFPNARLIFDNNTIVISQHFPPLYNCIIAVLYKGKVGTIMSDSNNASLS